MSQALAEATQSDPAGADSAIPAGFVALREPPGFVGVNGPLYIRYQRGIEGQPETNLVQMGFRVEARHCNPMGNLHGGMMATFGDMLLAVSALRKNAVARRHFLPTISLQLDYLSPGRLGAWIQGEAQVLRATRSMVFMQGLVSADGEPAARLSGVLKLGPTFKSMGFDHRAAAPEAPAA